MGWSESPDAVVETDWTEDTTVESSDWDAVAESEALTWTPRYGFGHGGFGHTPFGHGTTIEGGVRGD